MNRNRLLLAAIAVVVVMGVVALVLMRRGGGDEADAEPNPTATVTAARVQRTSLQDVVTLYGVVAADPSGAITVAAPKPAIVSQVLVRVGQAVAGGEPLVELADAPAAQLAYQQAADAERFARTDLARVQRLFDERLAARDQLEAARKALADAEAGLAAQQKQGAGRVSQRLTAPRAGVVTSVTAAAGDHVAQDAALVTLARAGGLVAKLGLEPTQGTFAPGDPVTLQMVSGGPAVHSRLTLVGAAADPTTKLFEATAPLNDAPLAVGAAVQGVVVTGVHVGLVVPKPAVVFDETGPHLFTLASGKAHRIFVKVGRDHGDNIEVIGPLKPGDAVAVQGADVLEDGMAVKVAG